MSSEPPTPPAPPAPPAGRIATWVALPIFLLGVAGTIDAVFDRKMPTPDQFLVRGAVFLALAALYAVLFAVLFRAPGSLASGAGRAAAAIGPTVYGGQCMGLRGMADSLGAGRAWSARDSGAVIGAVLVFGAVAAFAIFRRRRAARPAPPPPRPSA